jgi:hypothetical protein
MNYIGDYPEDFTTVCVYFTTHDANGAPVAPLTAFEADDVKIYKNGSAAQKTSTNGLTMTSPFDSIVGLHCLVIDTSNDTGDSGFWTTGGGSVYTVVLNPDTETVNGQVVVKVLATFGICLSADALLDRAAGVETSRTLRQSLRLMLSALAGKASGLATTTATFRDTNDTKDRIVATVDTSGNRSAVTLDAS